MANRPMGDFAFRTMSVIHDNPLRKIFDAPENSLQAAGVGPGQQVLEVGCGPGYFTVPAARLVGDEGFVQAIDLHPLAVEKVGRRIRQSGLSNVEVILADAAKTGLPDDSFDLTFLFGVVHSLPLEQVLPELHRVLKPGGVMAVQTSPWWSLESMTEGGLFTFIGKEGRVSKFEANSLHRNTG